MKLVQLGTMNDVKYSFHPNYYRLFRLRILGFMKGNPISHDSVATPYSGRIKLDFTKFSEIICFVVP